MAAVSRLGDLCTGHGCWPPRPGITASPNVIVNGIRTHRLGDGWLIHCCDGSCHPGVVASGSPTVMINGRPAARIGDRINCGSLIAQGSPNVNIGNGGQTVTGGITAGQLVSKVVSLL